MIIFWPENQKSSPKEKKDIFDLFEKKAITMPQNTPSGCLSNVNTVLICLYTDTKRLRKFLTSDNIAVAEVSSS